MIKVSVIIPVYNVEKYLPACLDSVLNQSLKELEIICIDDCSPDRCGEILDEYALKDERMKVIHLSENHRQGYGRNRGIERAEGRYLYFLDSDDTIVPEAMEELYELAERDHLDAVFFDSRDEYESEDLKSVYQSPFQQRKGEYEDRVYTGSDLLDAFITQQEWTCYPQRIFWRRQFIIGEKIMYPEGVEHEDEYFAFAGILAAKRARYVRKQYFILRIRPDSVMTSVPAPKNFHGYLLNFYYMNKFVAERGLQTAGIGANITRMYEMINLTYGLLKKEYDLSLICSSERDRILYRCFVSWVDSQTSENVSYNVDKHVLAEIRKYDGIYIYGAGIVGRRFCLKLEYFDNLPINGFIVSDKKNNPDYVAGRKVYGIDETEIPENMIVVVAVSLALKPEIGRKLDSMGIRWIYYRTL